MKARKLTKETILDLNVTDRKFPKFKVGDTIEVAQIVTEGNKERIQLFMGDVICDHNKGIASTFTVRRMGANNVGVERIFPYYSPVIDHITLVKKGDVNRAKLYYLRDRVGKSAKIKEKIQSKKQLEQIAQKEAAQAKDE